MDNDLLCPTPEGLYCPPGGFHIDPVLPVPRAVITHAHGDHAHPGSRTYYAAASGIDLLRDRLGDNAPIEARQEGQAFALGAAKVSFHPSGHIRGAAQIRIEALGRVAVVSGDYKRDHDPTCASFEPLPCDIFVTESTFALPIYRWPPVEQVMDDILAWLDECTMRGVAAVMFCYALGKTQRILAELARRTERTVYLHGATLQTVQRYRDAGVRMLPTEPTKDAGRSRDYAGALIIAPPSASGSSWMRRFGDASTAFVSGWMQVRGARRRRGYDSGFVMSDHADWPGLLASVRDTGARRIYVTHGDGDAFVRYLREQGHDAMPLRALGDAMPIRQPSEEGD